MTSSKHFDAIVVGLGAMGSAALYQIAKRGKRVLGIDQFSPPHNLGSTHGDTRITRLAIGEGLQYTPLAMRSCELWREIEQASDSTLLSITGGLIISSTGSAATAHVTDFFKNTVRTAEQFQIDHQILNATQIRCRFPQFNVQDNETGYYEPTAGFLRPEACISAQLQLASRHGAEIHPNEKVGTIAPLMESPDQFDQSDKICVRTSHETYSAEKLVVTAGPWLPKLLNSAVLPTLRVVPQILYWFEVQDYHCYDPVHCPVYIWELQHRSQIAYGFPAIDGPFGGVKIATEQYHTEGDPDDLHREVSEKQSRAMYDEYVAPHFYGIGRQCIRTVVCPYTVTPDSHFIIDTHPEYPDIILASPCSGHGFKHSAAIGEALAELVVSGKSNFDLSSFSLDRFQS